MQIEKIQGKIIFRIVGTNFCKNLHLAIFLRIIQFQALHENLYCADAVFFFSHFFLSLLVFFLPLCFLFENRIGPVFSFIMSYLQLHSKRE